MFLHKFEKIVFGALAALWIVTCTIPGFCWRDANAAQTQKSGSTKSSGARSSPDPCTLLSNSEVKQVQGEDVVEKKYSEQSGNSFLFRSCFYRTAAFANSISLSLAVPASAGKGAEGPRQYWMKHFRDADTSADSKAVEREKTEGGKEEEGERHSKPEEVKGIGEQAYWISNPRVGTLYVLERNYFMRISLGGKGTDDLRSKKAKDLARAALKRLSRNPSHTAANLNAGSTAARETE